MSYVVNYVFVPTRGTDETRFKKIPEFEGKTQSKAKLFKCVAKGFRMAGKIKEFVNKHQRAVHVYGSGYNGYGYTTENIEYLLTVKDSKVLLTMLDEAKARREANRGKQPQTPEKKKSAWARRLSTLTGVPMEECLDIAAEKLNYQIERINELVERQNERGWSDKREKLIRKIERENPLRRIKDESHAYNILAASVRHNSSDYESRLDEAKELAADGEIDYEEVKRYAREHTTYFGDIQSEFYDSDEGEEEE